MFRPDFLFPQPHSHADVFKFEQRYDSVWLWLDIETSGLHENADLLEIAAAITDGDLEVVDTLHVIVKKNKEEVARRASKWCATHFQSRVEGGNDLFELCNSSVIEEEEAGRILEAFIKKHCKSRRKDTDAQQRMVDAQKRQFFHANEFGDDLDSQKGTDYVQKDSVGNYRVMLAGCSVYFDRGVLLHKFPYLKNLIGHKTIDMTSCLEMVRRWRPDLLVNIPKPTGQHRALVDVLESVNLMRHMLRALFLPAPPAAAHGHPPAQGW